MSDDIATRIAPEAIEINNLTLAYQGHPAVHHVSGCFLPGSLTAIVGPNGAGKSTLLGAIAGQLQVVQGSIHFGQEKKGFLAYLPQQSSSFSAGQQFNICLIAISTVLFLACHFNHNTKFLKRFYGCVCCRECCSKFLSNSLDCESRHHW
jgi:ABC-type uncharacterized transport system ATPase subunit